jgi:hypothetical protein
MPPLGLAIGPHPPCTVCGSDGYPADLEVTVRGRDAWLCIDCWETHMPEAIRLAHPVNRAKALRLRNTPWSRNWRGWKRTTREQAEQPGLIIP